MTEPKKRTRIVNGQIVEESEGPLRTPNPQPYNMFPQQSTQQPTQQQPAARGRVTDTEEIPLAIPAVMLLLAEALFLNIEVVAITFVILLFLLAYLVYKN